MIAHIAIVWFFGEAFEGFTQHRPNSIRVHRFPFFVTRLVGIEDEYIWVIL
jgi:hypothetical protein